MTRRGNFSSSQNLRLRRIGVLIGILYISFSTTYGSIDFSNKTYEDKQEITCVEEIFSNYECSRCYQKELSNDSDKIEGFDTFTNNYQGDIRLYTSIDDSSFLPGRDTKSYEILSRKFFTSNNVIPSGTENDGIMVKSVWLGSS